MEALVGLIHLLILLELPHFLSDTPDMAPSKLILSENNVRVVSLK